MTDTISAPAVPSSSLPDATHFAPAINFSKSDKPAELKSVLVYAAGGDAPGQVAFLKPLLSQLLAGGTRVLTSHNRALFEGRPLFEVGWDTVNEMDVRDSSNPFGTTRSDTKARPAILAEMAARIRESGVSAMVVLGGDGSMAQAVLLAMQYDIPVIGVPKTMDGNLGIELAGELTPLASLGFYSAVDRSVEQIEKLRAKVARDRRVFVLELNGRNTGWITKETAEKTGLPYFIGEEPASILSLLQTADTMVETGGIILVAESASFHFDNQPIDHLQDVLEQPLAPIPLKLVESALEAPELTTRSICLGALMAYDYYQAQQERDSAFAELLASARSQQRLNIANIPRYLLEGLNTADEDFLALHDSVFEMDVWIPRIRRRFAEGALHLVVLPDDVRLSGMENYQSEAGVPGAGAPGAGTHKFGHARYQVRETSRTISSLIEEQIPNLAGRTTHYTSTYRLMAARASDRDVTLGAKLANATIHALQNGIRKQAIVSLRTTGEIYYAPLSALKEMEVPVARKLQPHRSPFLGRLRPIFYHR